MSMVSLRLAVKGSAPYFCPSCNDVFFTQGHMNNHLRASHPGFKYTCPMCSRRYSTFFRLEQHFSSIHEGKKHECDQCAYKSNFREHLVEHVNVVHRGIKFSCLECGHKYSSRSALIAHIKYLHRGIGGYRCKLCTFRTPKKRDFHWHVLAHVEGKQTRRRQPNRFICQRCQMICPSLEFLSHHEARGCSSDPALYPQ